MAPFGIDFLVVEPGPTGTGFGAGLDHAAPLPCYDATPAGAIRKAFVSGDFAIDGDARKTVAAMIAAAGSDAPPLRLTLGGGAFTSIQRALGERLATLEKQREVSFSTDVAR